MIKLIKLLNNTNSDRVTFYAIAAIILTWLITGMVIDTVAVMYGCG